MPTSPTAQRRILTQITPTKILGQISISKNQQVTMTKMDRTMFYRQINLRLTGSITTTGTSTTANIGAGDEWAIVQRIELVANGGNVLRSFTGEQLVMWNYLLTGYAKELNTLSGAAGTYNFDSTLPLWLCLPGMIGKNIDTTLNATLLSDLYLRITWGGDLTINALAGSTVATTTQISVSADQAFFLDRTIVPRFALTQIQSYTFGNIATTASGTQGYQYQIPVGQTYAAFLINAKTTGGTTDNAVALTGSGIIQSGSNQLYNMDMQIERMTNQERSYVPANNFTAFLNNTKNLFRGWLLLKFPKYTNITEALNLVNYQNCTFYIQQADAGNAVDLTVIPLTIIPTQQVTG